MGYQFGASFYPLPNSGYGHCSVKYYKGANCVPGNEDVGYWYDIGPMAGYTALGWTSYLTSAGSGPSSASAAIYCDSDSWGGYVDKLFLSPYGTF